MYFHTCFIYYDENNILIILSFFFQMIFITVLVLLVRTCTSQETCGIIQSNGYNQYGVCLCYKNSGYIYCRNRRLHQIPLFKGINGKKYSHLDLQDNNISNFTINDINSYDIVDLRNNPLNCQLYSSSLRAVLHIKSDCLLVTSSRSSLHPTSPYPSKEFQSHARITMDMMQDPKTSATQLTAGSHSTPDTADVSWMEVSTSDESQPHPTSAPLSVFVMQDDVATSPIQLVWGLSSGLVGSVVLLCISLALGIHAWRSHSLRR